MRVGIGYDVHKLVKERPLIIGGVEIPWEKGLAGHSDADVLTHAIIDALLGAVGLGDIGRHFPDNQEEFRDISSLVLLKKAGDLLNRENYRIVNIDGVIMAQRPKMLPYIPEMINHISSVLRIDKMCINIKATTTEQLGFIGREEGIAAQAIALVEKYRLIDFSEYDKQGGRKVSKKLSKIIIVILTLVVLMGGFSSVALADGTEVVSLGANLSEEQRGQILEVFGVEEDDVIIIEVTNQEEREYLEGKISESVIGTRAFSSAYVELLDDGEGISVETHNINWVTKEMYANAMVTAGVENARVIAASPFPVSGTAALTGIMKAFETATGEELTEEAKQAASDEMITTGELAEDIGQDEAASLVQEIKERIIKEKITDPEQIRKIIIEIAADLNINITQEHIDKLADLMERISKLDLRVEMYLGS